MKVTSAIRILKHTLRYLESIDPTLDVNLTLTCEQHAPRLCPTCMAPLFHIIDRHSHILLRCSSCDFYAIEEH